MKKVMVTGSTGFRFSNFIRKAFYEKQPYNFVSIDKITKSSVLNNIYVNKNHTFYIGDITDAHFVNVLFEYERPDIVIHAAEESLNDNCSIIKNNVFGTQVIIDACVKWSVEKLIYISTDKVYGHSVSKFTEEDKLNPNTTYAASKASAELLIQSAHKSYGLNYNIIRSSNNYGPRQTIDNFIPKIIKSILEDKKIQILENGLQVKDWTNIIDNCSAILTVLNKGKLNEIYNVSANQECSNIEVVQKICNLIGKGHNLIEHVSDIKNENLTCLIDCSKIQDLGWKAQVKLPDGLESCISWYQNNQWFLR